MIIDQRWLNKWVICAKFKYEDLDTLATSVHPGDWMGTLDLKDGYWHVPIKKSQWDLLGIQWKGKFYVFKTLLFGLSLAPFAFTKVMRGVVAELRQLGVHCQIYMDDIILLASSEEEWIAAREKALTLLFNLGLNVNWDKSDLVPVAGDGDRHKWREGAVPHPSQEAPRNSTGMLSPHSKGRERSSSSSPYSESYGIVRVSHTRSSTGADVAPQRTPQLGHKKVVGGQRIPISSSPRRPEVVERRSPRVERKARSSPASGLGTVHRRITVGVGGAFGSPQSTGSVQHDSPKWKQQPQGAVSNPASSESVPSPAAGKIGARKVRQRNVSRVRESSGRPIRLPLRYSSPTPEPVPRKRHRNPSSPHPRSGKRTGGRTEQEEGPGRLAGDGQSVQSSRGKMETALSRSIRGQRKSKASTVQQQVVDSGNSRSGHNAQKLVRGKQLDSPPILHDKEGGGEVDETTSASDSDSADVDGTGVVSPPKKKGGGTDETAFTGLPKGEFTLGGTMEELEMENVCIQDLWRDRVFTWRPRACEALIAALAESTFRKYNGYAKRFVQHCVLRGSTWEEATEGDVASFMDSVTSKSERPETTIKGVMAAILALYEGSGMHAPIHHPLLARLKKGFISLRTTREVKHRAPVPVERIVDWVSTLPPNVRLATDMLRLKLLALSAILLIARPSDLAKLLRPDLKNAPREFVPLAMLAFKNDYKRTGWHGKMFSSSMAALD
jgi:hypothetical protein